MHEEVAVHEALMEDQHRALLRLFRVVLASAGELRASLTAGFLAELVAHCEQFESCVFPELEGLSLGARLKVQALKAEHRALLLRFCELEVAGCSSDQLEAALMRHLDDERALLLPMLRRLDWLRRAAFLQVDSDLQLTAWSVEMGRASGFAGSEVIGRPVADFVAPLQGGARLALVVPSPQGAVAWFPPWVERAGSVAPSRLQAMATGDYPESLRPGLEAALQKLRLVVGAHTASLHLVDPESGRVWCAFQAGREGELTEGPERVLAASEPWTHRDDDGGETWVPLPGIDGNAGALGLRWDGNESSGETALTLLLWAATPLIMALEPLLDSVRYPGDSRLSPGVCQRVLHIT